ncbi:MAG: hypothetical protein AAF773_21060 [Cyanobacteria bacterium P01_D01_bin.115]
MTLAYLALFGGGLCTIWVAFRLAEEVIRIALVSTGAIAMLFGFFHSPAELQVAVEAVSLGGGWLTLRSR